MYYFSFICTKVYQSLRKYTNLSKSKNMQPHIEKAYNFIEKHLPFNYAEETQKILKKAEIKVSINTIRNVRQKKTTSNITVLNALLKVAKKHQKANEKLLLETQN